MKQITKIQPPKSFVEFCNKTHAIYDGSDFPKEELRQNLLSEQGHICCYCMKRIPEKIVDDNIVTYEMKVEHFKCQELHEDLRLTYSNLFGACTGNEGNPKKLQTCDTSKGNLDLTINPTSTAPNCETIIKYDADGEIYTDNDEINRQLNEVLNLNMQTLKESRKAIYLEVQKKVELESRKYADRNLKKNFFEQEKTKWLTRTTGKHKPYCMVAVYYLNKKIHANN